MQKILIVLLVLAAGFALSGVSAVVLAQVRSEKLATELTHSDSGVERQEVRLVITGTEELPNESTVLGTSSVDEEGDVVARLRESVKFSKSPDSSEAADGVPVEASESAESSIQDISSTHGVYDVPFYSQFTDITPVEWKKIGCGIASLAMLVDFYEPNSATVDELLQKGIASGAYINSAGWSHQGLIDLSKEFGLTGQSISLAGMSIDSAFEALTKVLMEGPVMASVHYTFDPSNPIPHLVVVTGVSDGKVFYNDPADKAGAGSVSISQFESAWKKRYIEIRPAL